MIAFQLVPHPDFPPQGVHEISVELRGGEDDLLLTYQAEGAEHLAVPARQSPVRADGLWRTTCFELFLRTGDDRYVEFNFSPSGQWAAYAFTHHRTGMTPLARDVPPHIERRDGGWDVDCDLGGLPDGPLPIALSAVIEELDGTKSYWALAHPPGAPDFHHPACFAATLPQSGEP